MFSFTYFSAPVLFRDHVEGFDTFRTCLSALVMSTAEMYPEATACHNMWTVLNLCTRILDDMPKAHVLRWGELSKLSNAELGERYRQPNWPHGYGSVDNQVDEEEAPF
jgi:hypothetical protein